MQRYRFPFLVGLVLMLILGSALLAGSLLGHAPAHATSSAADWTTYIHDPSHSGFNSTETILNPSSASKLQGQWTLNAGSSISTQAVVANGMIYWGSWDGIEHATNLNGTSAWTANLGTVTSASCGGASLGIASSATVATVNINGTATSVVFVGGGDTQFYALNAATGAVIWHTPIGAPPNNVIWSSLVFYNGSLYTSTASLCDNPLTQGQVFRLNAATGAIQNTFNVVVNACVGGGVWGSISIDASNGTLYFTTGTIDYSCPQAEVMAYGIVQLDASNLALIGFLASATRSTGTR